MSLRIALIGAGRVAATHASVWQAVPDVEVVAVADPRREAADPLAKGLGVRAFDSLEEVLEKTDADAVDIMTPHHLHHPLALRALHGGRHVFMDKPIAASVEQGRQLCDVAEAESLVLSVCHNLLFHPVLARSAGLVSGGDLGRITRAHAWSTGWLDLAPWDFRRDRNATGGGAWVDGSPHLVYLLEAFLGPMRTLTAALATGPSRLGGEDTAVGQAAFHSGAVAGITVGYSDCPPGIDTTWPNGWNLGVEVVGTDGRLKVQFLPGAELVWQRTGEPARTELLDRIPFDSGFAGAMEDFCRAVRTGDPLQVPARDSLRNLELVRSALGSDDSAS